MLIDLHNHTPLCNHATGNPEEYIQKALEKGIDIYGFADHAPMNFDRKYRMKFEEMDQYEQKIISLSQKYDNIKILLGYEVDFTPSVDKRVLERKVDYLIGSVHFLDNWGFDNPEFIREWKNRDINDIYKEYFYLIEKMADSKMFDIVGHIDLIKVFGHKPAKPVKDIAAKALKAVKKAGMAIELNTAGLRKPVKELYPGDELLEMILEENIDITFSSDAHSPEQVGFMLKQTVQKAKEAGFDKAVYFEKRKKTEVKI
jgi:histidinol-phosphatase (PHP family)